MCRMKVTRGDLDLLKTMTTNKHFEIVSKVVNDAM